MFVCRRARPISALPGHVRCWPVVLHSATDSILVPTPAGPRFHAQKLHEATKEARLNSPLFVKFAQGSSKSTGDALGEVMKKALPSASESAHSEVVRMAIKACRQAWRTSEKTVASGARRSR